MRAIADAAERWCDADFPPRVRATRRLMQRTGYTEPVVDYALDALFAGIDAETLRSTIAGELGSLAALDGFVPRPGRPDVTYAPLERVVILSSDTTIGVAIPALVFALCAGCSVVVKDRDDLLAGSFAETIATERSELGARIRVEAWPGGSDERSAAALANADAIVAYGRTETLALIRASAPALARFVGFGHKTSIAYVDAATIGDDDRARHAARGIAKDALLYDGEGCLSVHLVFVEGGPEAAKCFARTLLAACDAAAVEFPAGYAELDADARAIASAAAFRAAQGAGAAYGGTVAPHLVVVDPPRDDPPPWARRTLAVYAIDGPGDVAGFVRAHALPLEALAVADPADSAARAFALVTGATRIAAFGTLQRPSLGGEHGGDGRILPFVRAIYR